MTHPAYKIADGMLEAAAKIDDPDDAVRSIMDQVGIDEGGVAGIVFSGYRGLDWWPTASHHDRLEMLHEWVRVEQIYADEP